MKCPVDKTDTLSSIALIENLPAMQCSTCGGVWLDSNAYLAWRKAQGQDHPHKPAAAQVDPVWDVDELKLCPNSGHIMGRYKILADTDFHLDRCGHCNGIWFDKNEWDVLVELGLHDNVNEFFTRPWQDDLHAAETRNHLDKLYLEKFGAEDYERIKNVREWMNGHPRKGMLIAFLQSDDPYKV
ncbi:MAG: zf-TFIIB domain-containing protein [Anaerolineales bacterium]|nr:zf-TFIIB domain-containing protein [Anaerolineales bacterium]